MKTWEIVRLLCIGALALTTTLAQEETHERELSAMNGGVDCSTGECVEVTGMHRLLKKKKHKNRTPSPSPTPSTASSESDDDDDDDEDDSEDSSSSSSSPKASKAAKSEVADSTKEPTTTPSPTPTTAAPDTKAPESKLPATRTAGPESTAPESKAPETSAPTTTAPASTKAALETKVSEAPASTTVAPTPTPSTTPSDERIRGNKNEGVLDKSSEGSAEIDKIDVRNKENWTSVYNDPPLIVIKASLYAFIAYNDSEVCDTFNMTLNAVEQKPIGNESFAFHVVTDINCTKEGVDITKGRFVLNFLPEGKRLLLTECGHREEGEIVNWLRITDEVPQCMTPGQRKAYLSQRMKNVHTSENDTDLGPVKTDFFSRFQDLDRQEVAIIGSATVGLIAVIAVIVVFVMRKRKAQKDLERTIAGAKAEHAAEDDKPIVAEASGTVERKGLMDSAKAKPSELEEGEFVNSPSVKV